MVLPKLQAAFNLVLSKNPLNGWTIESGVGVTAKDCIVSVNGLYAFPMTAPEITALFQAVPVGQSITLRLTRFPAWYVEAEHLHARRAMISAISQFLSNPAPARAYERMFLLGADSFNAYKRTFTVRPRMLKLAADMQRERVEFERKELSEDRAALEACRAELLAFHGP